VLVISIAAVAVLLHTVCVAVIEDNAGIGFTTIVAICGALMQVLAMADTTTLADIEALVVFIAIKDGTESTPDAARPIEGVLVLQANVAPGVLLVKVILVVLELLQTDWLAGMLVTDGVGFANILKLVDGPGHPLAVGITVIKATTGIVPVFTAVNDGIPVAPLAARPIEVVLLVQL